jgi:hypothetical protein
LRIAVTNMTRLILTTDASTAGAIEKAGRAEIVIDLVPRLVWGPLPSEAELAAMLGPRTTQGPGSHWLDYAGRPAKEKVGGRDFGLLEPCGRCEAVELWFETKPNDQLVLIWLLDYLHSHADAATIAKLILCHVDASLGAALPEQLAKWKFPAIDISNGHLEIASLAWQAYRAPTPQPWFQLVEP